MPTTPTPRTASPAAGAAADTFRRELELFRKRLDRALAEWVEERHGAESLATADLAVAVGNLIAGGGKRLRPALVDAAYRACGGGFETAVLRLAMATELLHTYLLVHDDIMDHASVRRGEPTAHEVFTDHHRDREWPGDAAHYGRSVAILVGDLAHTWAAELSRTGLLVEDAPEGDPTAVARCFDTMSQEVIGGQYLEMTLPLGADRVPPTEEGLLRALRLKSGRYSVERPLELGALLAGADPPVLTALKRYGEAVGEAFQLQDDVLGTFGEAATVGKPVASDLEEGKYTLLVHHALAGASDGDRRWLRSALRRGSLDATEVESARQIIRKSGSLDTVLRMIEERLERGRAALADLPFAVADRLFLRGLIDYLAGRDR